MKNVTIVLREEVARWARVWAAHHDTSVSKMIGEMLAQRMEEEQGYEAAMNAFLGRQPKVLKEGGPYPTREEIHERRVLR